MKDIRQRIPRGSQAVGSAYPLCRALILISVMLVVGCSLFGGSTAKPSADADVENNQKSITELNDKVAGNGNAIVKMATQVTKNTSTISTVQKTIIETHETPFWKIALSVLPFFVVYLIWRLIRAKVAAGSTVKNFLFGA